MNFNSYRQFYIDNGFLPYNITWNRLPEYLKGIIESESYISEIQLVGTDLVFTAIGDAHNSTIDLSSLGGSGGGYLEGIDEGNGLGYRIKDQDPAKFVDTGYGTVDLQINDGYVGTDFGEASSAGLLVGGGNRLPSGVNNFGQHVAIGSSNTVQGYYNNMAIGTSNIITNGYSVVALGFSHDINLSSTVGQGLASGTANTLRGYWSSAIGAGLISKWKSALVIGEGNTDLGGTVDDLDRPLFVIGNGNVSSLTVNYADILSQSDAFIVRYDGSVEAPSITNALIDSTGAKSLTSREWVLENAGRGKFNLVNVDSAYTALTTDYTVNATANSFAITLPTAVGDQGKVYVIKNSGAGTISVNTTSGQTIDGNASGVITLSQYEGLTVQSDGTNWIIIES